MEETEEMGCDLCFWVRIYNMLGDRFPTNIQAKIPQNTMTNDYYYLGLDLSTQQLKGIVVDAQLKQVALAKVDFDRDLPAFGTKKGVFANAATQEVLAPVAMWLDAIDLLFARLKDLVDLGRVRGVSGACQQHGTVFWRTGAERLLAQLVGGDSLKEQLKNALAWEMSPNWQDHSTGKECRQFEACVGGVDQLAELTGSRAHHRFSGPQILKVKQRTPEVYDSTERIALVSSFVASVLAGKYVAIEESDACGMNLWNIRERRYEDSLLKLFGDDVGGIKQRLGEISGAGPNVAGVVSEYFVTKYGLCKECEVVPFTGDNPGTILSLPLRPDDVIVSLGTSTTALVVTNKYVSSPQYHLFAHPVAPESYMGMLCYCNGSLAREKVRDAVNGDASGSWDRFNEIAERDMAAGVVLGHGAEREVGFFFPLAEIIPSVAATHKRVSWASDGASTPAAVSEQWERPEDEVLAILESQALSVRSRLAPMLSTSDRLPRRVYFVGGASANATVCRALTRVLVPTEGGFRVPDMSDACAFGAAAKAVHGVLNCSGVDAQSWEEFIVARTRQEQFAEVQGSGSRGEDVYGERAVELFRRSEEVCFGSRQT